MSAEVCSSLVLQHFVFVADLLWFKGTFGKMPVVNEHVYLWRDVTVLSLSKSATTALPLSLNRLSAAGDHDNNVRGDVSFTLGTG